MQVERKGVYVRWTWEEYYKDCMGFAKAVTHLGVSKKGSVNIAGFNAPEWAVAFFGAIFANMVPCGIYTTNT